MNEKSKRSYHHFLSKLLLVLICIFLSGHMLPVWASVIFHSGNFYDPAFRKYLTDTYGFVENSTLSDTDLAKVKEIYISSYDYKIKYLKGIEYFPELKKVDMTFQSEIESADFTHNKKLEHVDLFGYGKGIGKLKTVKANGLTSLKYLNLSNNSLTSVDVSGDYALETFRCYSNYLPTIDVSTNGNLKELDCHDNQINLDTLNTSSSMSLGVLICYKNNLKSEDSEQPQTDPGDHRKQRSRIGGPLLLLLQCRRI